MTRESLFAGLFCKLGWHSWERLGTTVWLDEPLPSENRYGSAMEYRACRYCDAVTDVSAFLSTRDPDFGVANALGPLAAERWRQVMTMPPKPLPGEPSLPVKVLPRNWKDL